MEVDFAIHQSTDHRTVQLFKSMGGARVAQLPLEAFPDFWVYAYLVIFEDYRVLIDTGSGFGKSNQHLKNGLLAAGQLLNSDITFSNLTHILITHGHIDHF
ncbi:MAG: MBL fold metallo-hydrolase, partial [Chloroflexota bacterium]